MDAKELNIWFEENREYVDDKLRELNLSWTSLKLNQKLDLYADFEKELKEASALHKTARDFHAKPEVICYFKRERLKHESGDYRVWWKKLVYPIAKRFSKDFLFLCRLNNLHRN